MRKWSGFKTNHEIWQIAYLAGIIDGEGCFYLGHIKHGQYGCGMQWHSVMKVQVCDEELITWLENTFGGRKDTPHSRYTSKRTYERPVFGWQATGAMLDYLLPLIRPYLVIKPKQCDVMMQYRLTSKNIGSKRLPPEIHEKRIELMLQMRHLNSRFHNHPLKNPSALLP
jgi:hypothetical protein